MWPTFDFRVINKRQVCLEWGNRWVVIWFYYHIEHCDSCISVDHHHGSQVVWWGPSLVFTRLFSRFSRGSQANNSPSCHWMPLFDLLRPWGSIFTKDSHFHPLPHHHLYLHCCSCPSLHLTSQPLNQIHNTHHICPPPPFSQSNGSMNKSSCRKTKSVMHNAWQILWKPSMALLYTLGLRMVHHPPFVHSHPVVFWCNSQV